MDYLELDRSARLALKELGGDFNVQHVSPKSFITTSTILGKRPRRRVEPTHLLRLEKPFNTPRDVANAIGLSRVPKLESGSAEDGEASFVDFRKQALAP
jgi:hypothetical protein